MSQEVQKITVLYFRPSEGSTWCAQCVEYDIAAEGDSLHEVECNFLTGLEIRFRVAAEKGIDPLDLPAAPAIFREMSDRAPSLTSPDSQPVRFQSVEVDRRIDFAA